MMRSASDQPSSERRRFVLPRRLGPLAITLLVHLLLLLLLLTLSPPRTFVPMGASRLISIALNSDKQDDSAAAKSKAKAKQAAQAPAAAPKTAPPPPPMPVPVPKEPVPDYPLLKLTHDEMVGLDATLRASPPGTRSADAQGSGSGDSAKVGTGPRGEALYAADWYREPTDTELNFYLPKGRRVLGRGTIACRTVARFHVDDCEIVSESPSGSGLAYAVQQAAWQFLVRPPRVGGRSMVGEWVTISITWNEGGPRLER
jgi:protein TonB